MHWTKPSVLCNLSDLGSTEKTFVAWDIYFYIKDIKCELMRAWAFVLSIGILLD